MRIAHIGQPAEVLVIAHAYMNVMDFNIFYAKSNDVKCTRFLETTQIEIKYKPRGVSYMSCRFHTQGNC